MLLYKWICPKCETDYEGPDEIQAQEKICIHCDRPGWERSMSEAMDRKYGPQRGGRRLSTARRLFRP